MQMMLVGARSVTLAENMPVGAVGSVLLQTTPDTWGETDMDDLEQSRAPTLDPEDMEGPIPVAAAVVLQVEEPKQARIVVIGDGDLASNQGIDNAAHSNFLLNTVAWLTESEDLIAIRSRGHEDEPIVLSESEKQVIAWLAALFVVQVIAVAGMAAHFLRRRHQ